MGLLKVAVNGVAWTTIATVINSVVSLLQVSILTRYLSKADFGIVAIATLFIGFTNIFLNLGVSIGIMHKHDITPKQYSSLFWLNIFCGIGLTLILCSISPLVAMLYEEPSLIPILCLLSCTLFFASLGSQHSTVQQKKMRFKYIAIVNITSSILTLCVAYTLVCNEFGIYSLVFSTLFGSLFSNLVFLTIGLYKDRNIFFHFNLKETYPFLKIGIYSIGSQILDYFSRELDIIIISTTLGKESVGVYSLCKRLVLAVYGSINPILMRVLTPILSSIHEDVERVRTIYYDVVESLSVVNAPVFSLIAIFSTGILNFLYGNQYIDNAPVLSLLAIFYAFSATNNPVGSLQTAYGRTDLGFYWTIMRIITTIIFIFIGSLWGINGILIVMIIGSLITYPFFWKITIYPLIGGKFIGLCKKALTPVLLNTVIAIPFVITIYHMTNFVGCIVGGILYTLIILIATFFFMKESYIVCICKQQIRKYPKTDKNKL